MDIKIGTKRIEYRRRLFAMRQVRDCVAGSDAVKRAGQLYLPMPGGMAISTPGATSTQSTNALAEKSFVAGEAPWHHSPPAYSAYVHRAKFPDMTGCTLRGLVGVATRRLAEMKLTGAITYLQETATITGDSLFQLFKRCVSEVMQTGRYALVLDVRTDNTLYVAEYPSETYINWKEQVLAGKKVQTYAEFETIEENDQGEDEVKTLVYKLTDMHPDHLGKYVCVFVKYTDGLMDLTGEQVLTIQGKPAEVLPIINIGVEDNCPAPGPIPLMGVADCAMDIYRHSADLNQNQFQSCNPTLVYIGVDSDDAPRMIGSTIAVCLSSPDSDAKYLTTDTTALTHVAQYIQDVFAEAINYGSNLLGPSKRGAESAEALALRQASSGATLVTMVAQCGDAMQDVLDLAASLVGGSGFFEPNMEFAEMSLTAQEMTALLQVWMSGGISHLSLLENFVLAGKTGDRTAEEELAQIEQEPPIGGSLKPPTEDEEEEEDEEDEDEEEDEEEEENADA